MALVVRAGGGNFVLRIVLRIQGVRYHSTAANAAFNLLGAVWLVNALGIADIPCVGDLAANAVYAFKAPSMPC